MSIQGINGDRSQAIGEQQPRKAGSRDKTDEKNRGVLGSSALPDEDITSLSLGGEIVKDAPADLQEARDLLGELKSVMTLDPDRVLCAHSGKKIRADGLAE